MKVRQDVMTAKAEAVVCRERKFEGGAYPDAHNSRTAGTNPEAEAIEDSQIICSRSPCCLKLYVLQGHAEAVPMKVGCHDMKAGCHDRGGGGICVERPQVWGRCVPGMRMIH